MGLFDIFKSKEEREDLIKKLQDQIFPGGNEQFLREVTELRERLNFKYSQNDIVKTYSHAVGIYHVSNRNENEIVNSILHNANSVVTRQDAVSVCDYLKEKYSKEEIKKSFFILADKFNCSPTEVANFFLNNLEKQNFSLTEIDESINHWHNKRIEEAKALSMSAENTPASLMEIWTREFKDKRYNTNHNENEPTKTTAKRLLKLAGESIDSLKHIETIANDLDSDRDEIHLLTKNGEVEVLLFNSNYILNLYRVKVKIRYEDVRDEYMSLLEGEIQKMINVNSFDDFVYFLNSRMEFYSDELNRLNSQGGLPINLFNSFMVNPLQDDGENIIPSQADITIFRNQFKEMINVIREGVSLIGKD